jgi:hypothetical protein
MRKPYQSMIDAYDRVANKFRRNAEILDAISGRLEDAETLEDVEDLELYIESVKGEMPEHDYEQMKKMIKYEVLPHFIEKETD